MRLLATPARIGNNGTRKFTYLLQLVYMEEDKKIEALRTCFVIMPITDPADYESGHFARVYDHIIKPACKDAGLIPLRADDVKATNYIVLDILNRIITSPIVICDLSGRNPNVLYELGIRHSFDLPVVLIKDRRTERVFDIQGLRTLEYDESLRVDTVKRDIDNLRATLQATGTSSAQDVNSLVTMLGIPKARVSESKEISQETALILTSIKDISERLSNLEERTQEAKAYEVMGSAGRKFVRPGPAQLQFILPKGEKAEFGDSIYDGNGNEIGDLVRVEADGVVLQAKGTAFLVSPDDRLFGKLTTIPF